MIVRRRPDARSPGPRGSASLSVCGEPTPRFPQASRPRALHAADRQPVAVERLAEQPARSRTSSRTGIDPQAHAGSGCGRARCRRRARRMCRTLIAQVGRALSMTEESWRRAADRLANVGHAEARTTRLASLAAFEFSAERFDGVCPARRVRLRLTRPVYPSGGAMYDCRRPREDRPAPDATADRPRRRGHRTDPQP